MKLKLKKLHPNAIVPTKATEGSAAYDLYATEDLYLQPTVTGCVSIGWAMEIPVGWKGDIYSRSGLALKGVVVANSPGKIDSDYRGEVKIILQNTCGMGIAGIRAGDRVAQFELSPVYDIEFEETISLDITSRGDEGFGSTGK